MLSGVDDPMEIRNQSAGSVNVGVTFSVSNSVGVRSLGSLMLRQSTVGVWGSAGHDS